MRKIVVIYLFIVSAVLLLPCSTFARLYHEGRIRGLTTVSALVPSKVSAEKSQVQSSVSEILAELSQRVVITINLKDKDGNSLPNIKVELYSNRGEIDSVTAIKAKDGNLSVLSPEEKTDNNINQTDEKGTAIFKVSSTVAGEAILIPIADNIVQLPPIKIKFLPLPFPENVTVSIDVPTFINPQGKIVLFKPTEYTIDKQKLINKGIEIRIPTSLFLALAFIILIFPILFFAIFRLIRKVKKAEEKEVSYIKNEHDYLKRQTELLEKIAQKDNPKESRGS